MDKETKTKCLTITDEAGNERTFSGSMEGFVVRTAEGCGLSRTHPPIGIRGLDRSWLGKKVVCILLEEP